MLSGILALTGAFLFGFFGLEQSALAWGTGAHIDFGMSILANAAMLTPAVRALLKRFPKDYLYGNIAADTVIGKNMAQSEEDHVHNWEVALKLFDHATDDAGRAFVYGYLSHLSADTVAHNYFVPKKRIDSFATVTTGHAYWELRYDSFLPESVWEVSKDLARHRFPQHDALLEAGLKTTLFSMKTNRTVFGGFFQLSNRIDRWRHMMRSHADRSATPFGLEERQEIRTLALNAVAGFLVEGRDSHTFRADPTGNGNLEKAWKIGTLLRRNTAAGLMEHGEAHQIARSVGKALREGLHVQREVDFTATLRKVS